MSSVYSFKTRARDGEVAVSQQALSSSRLCVWGNRVSGRAGAGSGRRLSGWITDVAAITDGRVSDHCCPGRNLRGRLFDEAPKGGGVGDPSSTYTVSIGQYGPCNPIRPSETLSRFRLSERAIIKLGVGVPCARRGRRLGDRF